MAVDGNAILQRGGEEPYRNDGKMWTLHTDASPHKVLEALEGKAGIVITSLF